jgi:hypothetical protein
MGRSGEAGCFWLLSGKHFLLFLILVISNLEKKTATKLLCTKHSADSYTLDLLILKSYNAHIQPPSKIPWSHYTHIDYFVAPVQNDPANPLKIEDEKNLKETVELAKAHNVSISLVSAFYFCSGICGKGHRTETMPVVILVHRRLDRQ